MGVRNVEAIPLEHSLKKGRRFGGTRGLTGTRSLTLVRLETADGAVGWGEALAPPRTVAAAVEEQFAADVVGMNPWDVSSLVSDTYAGSYHFGRGPVAHSALSAIDIALWDLLGKETGEPVYRLLGTTDGSQFLDHEDPTELVPYASTMYITEWGEDPADPIREAVAEGFEAAKIKIGRNVDDDVARVATAREILGDDAYLMVDFNGNYRPKRAAAAAAALAEFDITWMEEPVPPENEAGYRELRRHTEIPLAAGEAHFDRFEFAHLVEEGLVDIVQPNVTHCGGLSEARFIAKLATTRNVTVRPHVWNGGVGTAAAAHFAASLPAYPHAGSRPEPVLFEFDRSENPLRDELLPDPFNPTDGALTVPDDPGLGVEVDGSVVDQYRVD